MKSQTRSKQNENVAKEISRPSNVDQQYNTPYMLIEYTNK